MDSDAAYQSNHVGVGLFADILRLLNVQDKVLLLFVTSRSCRGGEGRIGEGGEGRGGEGRGGEGRGGEGRGGKL